MNKIAQATDNSKESPEKIALKDYQNSKSALLKTASNFIKIIILRLIQL